MTGFDGEHGRSVVFLHGAGADHTVWRFQTRWLAGRGWRVIAPDLPGHGRTEGELHSSIEESAEWLIERIEPLAAPVVVGHSMGALIALEAAGSVDAMAALVLVGAGLTMPVHPGLIQAAHDDLDRAADLIAGWSLPTAHRGGHAEPGSWHAGATRALVARSAAGALATDLQACAVYDATEAASRITVPATVVSGTEDRMVRPAASRELAGAVRDAEHVLISHAGHEPMLQRPAEFNDVLARALVYGGKQSDR